MSITDFDIPNLGQNENMLLLKTFEGSSGQTQAANTLTAG